MYVSCYTKPCVLLRYRVYCVVFRVCGVPIYVYVYVYVYTYTYIYICIYTIKAIEKESCVRQPPQNNVIDMLESNGLVTGEYELRKSNGILGIRNSRWIATGQQAVNPDIDDETTASFADIVSAKAHYTDRCLF